MQFTTGLLSLALAAIGVSAAPNSAIEARQAGVVYVRFYPQGGCQGPWLEDTVYFDDASGTCRTETFQGAYASWRIERNEAIRDLTLFTNTDCSITNGGNVITVPAGVSDCFTERIGSTQFVL
jgi:hypothetical protein